EPQGEEPKMVGPAIRQQSDAVLLPFLDASGESEVERLLTELMVVLVQPIIKKIVRSYIGRSGHELQNAHEIQDIEDVIGEANLQILDRLGHLRSTPHNMPIRNFVGYIKVTTYNACHKYLRQKYPKRSRLKCKLRYILTHNKGFALWEDENQNWICGFANWKRLQPRLQPLTPGGVRQLQSDQQALEKDRLSWNSINNPIELLRSIFDCAHQPIEIDDLVTIVAELWQVKDYTQTEIDEELTTIPNTYSTAHAANSATNIEERIYLQRLWAEICQLPVKQRQSLLLNLRDTHEQSLIILFTDIHIASIRQIAEALAMPVEKLAELWNDLPLDDAIIARYLSVDRQQIINYRLSARRRLARRMQH
ncbi:MAG: hypothetical protein ACRD63_14300, partial [Pyrinomonadaceae bacterium]